MSLLTKTKLKENCGRITTNVIDRYGVGLTVPNRITKLDLFAKVTQDEMLYGWKVKKG